MVGVSARKGEFSIVCEVLHPSRISVGIQSFLVSDSITYKQDFSGNRVYNMLFKFPSTNLQLQSHQQTPFLIMAIRLLNWLIDRWI